MDPKASALQQLDDEYMAIHMGKRLRNNPLALLGSTKANIGNRSGLRDILMNAIGAAGIYDRLTDSIQIAKDFLPSGDAESQKVYDDIMMHELMHPALNKINGSLANLWTDRNHDIINYIGVNDPEGSTWQMLNARAGLPADADQEYADQLRSEVEMAQQSALSLLNEKLTQR